MLWALAAVFLCATPAAAAPVKMSGSLVVRWHSNPETCADQGLCDRYGMLSWRPESDFGSVDLVEGFGLLSLFGTEAVARSYRSDGSACIDRTSAPADLTAVAEKRGLVFSMRKVVEFDSGRCAGPLGSDFAPSLPESPPVSAAALRRGALIDLRARAPFSSGPFEGEVISTLTIRSGREVSDSGGTSRRVPPERRRGRRARYGEVTASYAVEALTGDAGYTLTGAPDAECMPFDTCGLTGDVTVHAGVHEGELTVSTKRALPAGASETVGGGLRALRRGGTHVFGDVRLGPAFDPDTETPFAAPFGIPFTETATAPDSATCSDSGSFREPYLDVRRTRNGVSLRLLHGGNSEPDPLRTRCPGPGSDDVGAFATGVLPLASVGQSRIEMTLRPSAAFTMVGLRGTGRGELKLSLRLLSLRARAQTVRVQHEEPF